MRNGKYYLGRLIKEGELSADDIAAAFKESVTLEGERFNWAITGYAEMRSENRLQWVYGRLSKFRPVGEILAVDESQKEEVALQQENLLVSSAPFIFVPQFSGIMHLQIPPHLSHDVFRLRLAEIFQVTRIDNPFVSISIAPVTDLLSFVTRLRSIAAIEVIKAKVNPPNPLFGPLWRSLRDYLRERHAQELKLEERGTKQRPLVSQLPELVDRAIAITKDFEERSRYFTHPDRSNEEAYAEYIRDRFRELEPPPLTESALLMATDGYGEASVRGMDTWGKSMSVSTRDRVVVVPFDRDAAPEDLYRIAVEQFTRISITRGLDH